MARAEKLATLVGIGTSLATVVILVAELPKDESSFNVWLGLSAAVAIIALLLAYYVYFNRQRDRIASRNSRQKTEERRLRGEFPAIFAFVESIGEIRTQDDFQQFVTRLNHLLELERRARGIKLSDVKDIETMKAIAYAQLVEKRADHERQF